MFISDMKPVESQGMKFSDPYGPRHMLKSKMTQFNTSN